MSYQHWMYKCPTTHYKGCGFKQSIFEWFGTYDQATRITTCPKCGLRINENKLESCGEEVKIIED